ncbi:S46 family peptidase, partial [Bacteroidia bacterium]|nr:S46 family peptidase [Bacteroidia bacterium]
LTGHESEIRKSLGSYRGVANTESMDVKLFTELYYRLSQSKLESIKKVFTSPTIRQDEASIKAYAAQLWNKSKLNDVTKNSKLIDSNIPKFLKVKGALVEMGRDVNAIFGTMQAEMSQINAEIDEIIPRFNDLEMEINGGSFVPDANSTLRFTYGYVKGYEPEDAVVLNPFTTIQGIIEKAEGTDNPDYFLQPEFLDKLKNIEPADVLRHPDNNEVVVGLLYNMDTTGGNSGSPIMDSKGRIVGINFDRAYTATINDYAWNESYSRSIGVDIRYVLYVMKYFGEADVVLAEMGVEL